MKTKNKFVTIGIVLTTLALAGVAIFTAIRLYQTRTTPVAPNAPESNPNASGTMCGGIAGITCPSGEDCIYSDGSRRAPFPDASGTCTASSGARIVTNNCQLTFTITTATATATSTSTSSSSPTATATATSTSTSSSSPTATATATVTASPNPQCNYSCTSNSNCPSGLMCYIPSGSTAGNCRNTQCLSESDCLCAVVTATPTTTAVATQPSLPVVGTSWPTILGTGFGILVIIGSLLLAL